MIFFIFIKIAAFFFNLWGIKNFFFFIFRFQIYYQGGLEGFNFKVFYCTERRFGFRLALIYYLIKCNFQFNGVGINLMKFFRG